MTVAARVQLRNDIDARQRLRTLCRTAASCWYGVLITASAQPPAKHAFRGKADDHQQQRRLP
jgi:hypothetical protein